MVFLRWFLVGLFLVQAWGCNEKEKVRLLLSVKAIEPIETFDLIVAHPHTGERHLERKGVFVDGELDITLEALKLRVDFTRRGDYLIHMVGHREGGDDQYYSDLIGIRGEVRRSVLLVPLEGADNDGDGFVDEGDCHIIEDAGGICNVFDCDDTDSDIHPLALEICGDGIDQNCDGEDLECMDADGDGYPEDVDCDDEDPDRNPGRKEYINNCPTEEHPEGIENPLCGDGVDQDCDGVDLICRPDNDCDGWWAEEDCDDEDPTIHPFADELCGDGLDNDCDGKTDEGCMPCDIDGDGYQRFDPANACPDADYLNLGLPTDCNDLDSSIFPNLTEDYYLCNGLEGGVPNCGLLALCDGKDNDCDGQTDEGCPVSLAVPPSCDEDGDGFLRGDDPSCSAPAGLEDCDDSNPHIFPGAPDVCGDGILQNCVMDTPCNFDNDGDGYNRGEDCDDSNPEVAPWKVEKCDGVDNDCDGVTDEGNPDATGEPLSSSRYCNDDHDGICGVPPTASGGMEGSYCNPDYEGTNPACTNPPYGGTGVCVCSPVVPSTSRDPGNRVTCPGEDLGLDASPRCFFAPQPKEKDTCGDGVDEDCDPDTSDGYGDCVGDTPDCCVDLGICVNTSTDPSHCGGCGISCDFEYANRCVDGECRCGDNPPCEPGQACVTSGGDPTLAECVCGPSTCPGGCCDGNVCVLSMNQNDGVCGQNGEACQNCGVQGLDCNAGQCFCVAGGNCPGCCDGNVCLEGTGDAADTHCGIAGFPCTDCTLSNRDCDAAGQCVCTQGGNCPGCCDGNLCRAGTSYTYCGHDGQQCATCGICKFCNATQSCVNVPAGTDPQNQCTAQSEVSCGTTGICDGSGACSYWNAGTLCSSAACIIHIYYPPDTCNSQHQCIDSGSIDCTPYMCNLSGCLDVCTTHGDCVATHYCTGGTCIPKKPQGDSCNNNQECTTGYCIDGYCCNTVCNGVCEACDISGSLGTCSPHSAGSDPEEDCPTEAPCGFTGSCNGNRACAYWPLGTVCASSSCQGSVFYFQDTCSVTHACADGGVQNCHPYVCDGSGCLTSCTFAGDCVLGHYCENNICKAERPLGNICVEDYECISGHCADGVCCDNECTETCEACDQTGDEGYCLPYTANTDPEGECTGICRSCNGAGACQDTGSGLDSENDCVQQPPCGTNGQCDGGGACAYWAVGTECSVESCAGSTYYPSDTCDAAHTCVDSGSQECSPYICNSSGCLTSCTNTSQCVLGYYCIGSACVKKPQGYSCTLDDECLSNHCVDGYCCDDACTGTCESCDQSGGEGSCLPYNINTDPEGECSGTCRSCNGAGACHDTAAGVDDENECTMESPCGLNGDCDGGGACAYWSAGTECVAESCVGSTYYPSDTCDAAHTCVDSGSQECSPYICNASGCLTSCTGQSDCVSTYYCDIGPGDCLDKKASGEACNENYECESGSCTTNLCD